MKEYNVVIISGSDSDLPHIKKIQDELGKFKIESNIRICSAHKQPVACENIIKELNASSLPTVIVSIAGATDALSGVLSFHSVHPVISCPPDKTNFFSCIDNPPGSSNSLILRPANVAKHIAQMLCLVNADFKQIVIEKNNEKIAKLTAADQENRS
ncbi:MAG: AIR carboxylase family protein [Desulfobacteraceae bacterium]|nr:MAG: AIR carboxylase family protein [Desulfobacteraceae bacterium]